jgi:tetratricopeptide (TPR) repeat protein
VGPPAPASAAAPARPVVAAPSQALIDKLGAGDRAFLATDFRSALFLYQDAVYMAPTAVSARLRLARCYAALRYPAQAEAQVLQALEIDPGSAEASRLLAELRNPPPRPPSSPRVALPEVGAAAAVPMPLAPPAAAPPAAAPPPTSGSPTSYRLSEEPSAPEVTAASRQGAADLYRAAVAQISDREFAKAVDSLSRALEKDPGLAVAFEARASARFGLGLHEEASRDYQRAAALSPGRASPIWGLAECYRLLGDPRAAETYQRYADSPAPDVTEPQRKEARIRAQDLRPR